MEKYKKEMKNIRDKFFETNSNIKKEIKELEKKIKVNKINENEQAIDKLKDKIYSKKQEIQAEKDSFKNRLTEVYNKAQEEVKSQLFDFGDTGADKTDTILNNLDLMSKKEKQIIAERFNKEGNYVGQKGLMQDDPTNSTGFVSVEQQLKKLDNTYNTQASYIEKYDSMEQMQRSAMGLPSKEAK